MVFLRLFYFTFVCVVVAATVDLVDENQCIENNPKTKISRDESAHKALSQLSQEWVNPTEPLRPLFVTDELYHILIGECFSNLPPTDGSACWETKRITYLVQGLCDREKQTYICKLQFIQYATEWRQKRRSSEFLAYLRLRTTNDGVHPGTTGFSYKDLETAYTEAIREDRVVQEQEEQENNEEVLTIFETSRHRDTILKTRQRQSVEKPYPTITEVHNWIAFLAHSSAPDACGRLVVFLNYCFRSLHHFGSIEMRRARAIVLNGMSQYDMAAEEWTFIIQNAEDSQLVQEALRSRHVN